MLDLNQNKAEGVGTHKAVKLARVGQDEKWTGTWSVDFTPASEDDAIVCDELVPGAHRLWLQAEAAREDAKEASATEGAAAGSTALAGVEGRSHVQLRNANVVVTVAGPGGVLCELPAKVLLVTFRATGRQVYLRVKFEAENLTLSDVANLVRCSELENATVSVERKQYELTLPAEKADTEHEENVAALTKPVTKRRPRAASSGSARA